VLERFEQSNANSSFNQALIAPSGVIEVYEEMFQLLEDYAPSWYTEDLHNRAAAGLETLKARGRVAVTPKR